MANSNFPALEHALKANIRLIVISTKEDDRAMACAGEVCRKLCRSFEYWDESTGFVATMPLSPATNVAAAITEGSTPIAFALVDKVLASSPPQTIIARRLDRLFSISEVKNSNGRRPISLLRSHFANPVKAGTTLIFVAEPDDIPDEWKPLAHLIEFPLPRLDVLAEVLDGAVEKLKAAPPALNSREALIDASLGMTAIQAGRAFSLAYVENGGFNENAIQSVTEQKQQVIRQSEALEFIPWASTVPEYEVAGLDVLKHWLTQRRAAYTPEAEAFGLTPPKGVLLIGVPGTGKSLAAKMVGRLWKQPLLRLDMGALFNKYVGESEKRTREALHLAATISPCILWIDEIEKGIDTSSGERDGGSSQRMLGTLLTWMQERKDRVFVVATANRVDRLPPELKRSGRFDQIFEIKVPNYVERLKAFQVHLAKAKQESMYGKGELHAVILASEGFTGAEIEQVVKESVVDAFLVDDPQNNRRPVSPPQLLKHVNLLRPVVTERTKNCSSMQLDFAVSASSDCEDQTQ